MDIENNVVVIIPTYNESKNISILLDLLVNLSIDILIVDDNSPDGNSKNSSKFFC